MFGIDDQLQQLLLDSLVPLLVGAVRGTIPLTLLSFTIGLVIALVVALARISRWRVLRWVARADLATLGLPAPIRKLLNE